MLCYEGKLSLYCFSSAAFSLVLLWIFFDLGVFSGPVGFWMRAILLGLYYVTLNVIIRLKFNTKDYQVAVRATFLGAIFSLGVVIYQSCDEEYKSFGLYGTLMAIFHYSEYLGIAFCNPKTLSPDSFILNHSIHYALAAAASWVEYFIEVYFFPEMKTYRLLWILGLILCLGGETLRKLAMITASKNFSHIVQFQRQQEHELVTYGVYSLMRHPSYVGWFWWSIGTQVVLANPVCFVIYTIASWKFFHDRIFMEEITLLNFFGDEYYKYQQRVPTGLPFIRGFKVDLCYSEKDHPGDNFDEEDEEEDEPEDDQYEDDLGKRRCCLPDGDQTDKKTEQLLQPPVVVIRPSKGGRDNTSRIMLKDSGDEEDDLANGDDRRNMTGNFYHGRNRRYSGSYDNVCDESTIV